jgi:type IV secretory pathway VirB2 component (pilin)
MVYIKSSLLGACLILFFLPFVEIKCNEENLVNASAMELAFARPLKVNTPAMFDQYLGENSEMNEAMNAINSEKRKPDVLLIAYLVCLIAGIALLFAPKPKLQFGSVVTIILALLSLIGFYFVYKKGWEDNVSGDLGSIPMVSLSLHFGWALWLSMLLLISFIAVQVAQYLSERKDRQLELYNPNAISGEEQKELD